MVCDLSEPVSHSVSDQAKQPLSETEVRARIREGNARRAH